MSFSNNLLNTGQREREVYNYIDDVVHAWEQLHTRDHLLRWRGAQTLPMTGLITVLRETKPVL